MDRYRSIVWAGTIGVVAGVCLSWVDARASPSGFCDPGTIVTKFIDQEFEDARKRNRFCIEYYRDLTAGLSPHTGLNGWQWLHVVLVGYHLANASQIAAEMGRHAAAADFIDEARSHAGLWSNFFETPLVRWDDIINVTIGFQLERKGAIEEAKRWYETHPDTHTYARLAAIALSEQNAREATDRAAQALELHPRNLTAMIVLAAIAEKDEYGVVSGIERDAIAEVKKILKQSNFTYQYMPVYYGEIWWAKVWIEDLGTIGMPPRENLP